MQKHIYILTAITYLATLAQLLPAVRLLAAGCRRGGKHDIRLLLRDFPGQTMQYYVEQ
jgi:hypothetical protein